MVAVIAPDPDGVVVAIPAATVVTVAVVGSYVREKKQLSSTDAQCSY